MKPLIGITCSYNSKDKILYVPTGYYNAIEECGGIPLILPLLTNENNIKEIIQHINGLMLIGGPDIDPIHFGEEPIPQNGEISPERDFNEITLTKEALSKDKPILGICRGCQILAVAAGGDIYQDITTQIRGEILKHRQEAPFWYPTHNVYIEKNSLLEKIFNKSQIRVNSYHHQSIRKVPDNFIVSAKSTDGIVEGIEGVKNRFAIGVQWHPELMWEKEGDFLKLFKFFVIAAQK